MIRRLIEGGAPIASAECGTLPRPATGRNENFKINFKSTTYKVNIKYLQGMVRCDKAWRALHAQLGHRQAKVHTTQSEAVRK